MTGCRISPPVPSRIAAPEGLAVPSAQPQEDGRPADTGLRRRELPAAQFAHVPAFAPILRHGVHCLLVALLLGFVVGPARAAAIGAGPAQAAGREEGRFAAPPPAPRMKPSEERNAGSPRFTVTRTASRIKIDGVLDEEAWKSATVIPLPYEWQPGDNIPAPVKTECLVTYDLHNLYIAFRCFDPEPGKIRAHLMDRDDADTLIMDDHVSVLLDSFNDERRAFQFRVNPLGVQADAILSESEGFEDFSWDAIWNAAGRIEDWGWAVEAALPFSQLRFKKTDGPQTWGFSAERSWPRDSRHRITSHVRSRNVACILCQFNKITGFEGIVPGRNIELDPTYTVSRTDTREVFPGGPLVRGKAKDEFWVTGKWGVTPNLILNATANPDFSQVEADVAQLSINRRFALFFPEKRPFFLEAADFFLTPVQAVFTRTVADPLWGTKLTGKVGKTAIGIFGAQDEVTNLIFPSNQFSDSTSLDQHAYGGVFRLRQDVGKRSTLGVLYTGRAGKDYYNHVGGADAFLWLDEKNFLTFQYLRSETKYPQAVAEDFGQSPAGFGGNAFCFEYQHMDRNWTVDGTYRDLGAGFRADYGYVPRVDTRNAALTVLRQIWGKERSWFNRIQIGFAGEFVYDHAGTLTDRNFMIGLAYVGKLESLVNVHALLTRTFFSGQFFETPQAEFQLQIRPWSGTQIGAQGFVGRYIDFANVRRANIVSIGPTLAFSLGRHFNVVASHMYERLYLPAGTIYTANLPQAKFIYNFNTRLFVRAILQYNDVEQNQALYASPVDTHSRHLFTQFLFSFKLNPRTVFFLGYSDNSLGGDLERSFGVRMVDLTRTDRSFFLKLAYALQL